MLYTLQIEEVSLPDAGSSFAVSLSILQTSRTRLARLLAASDQSFFICKVVVAVFEQVNMAALRGISLKMVNEIKMKFDPFHPEAATVR